MGKIGFSIIMPMDTNRLEQFKHTKRVYDTFPQLKEFIIPTRSKKELTQYFATHQLNKNVTLVPYKVEKGFNPSKAFNLGVNRAKYDRIIITSPEVMPLSSVLEQFERDIEENIICHVWDENEEGSRTSLVDTGYRNLTPAMYFLALFQKPDIKTINGWDEEFMKGYSYEDDDFGERWNRAGLSFQVRDDIQALHQYHPRSETIEGGTFTNYERLQENNIQGIIKCANGLKRL